MSSSLTCRTERMHIFLNQVPGYAYIVEDLVFMEVWQRWSMHRTENPENLVRLQGPPRDTCPSGLGASLWMKITSVRI